MTKQTPSHRLLVPPAAAIRLERQRAGGQMVEGGAEAPQVYAGIKDGWVPFGIVHGGEDGWVL